MEGELNQREGKRGKSSQSWEEIPTCLAVCPVAVFKLWKTPAAKSIYWSMKLN
jgi:hypothetical protein